LGGAGITGAAIGALGKGSTWAIIFVVAVVLAGIIVWMIRGMKTDTKERRRR
jgi:hypothetical protein